MCFSSSFSDSDRSSFSFQVLLPRRRRRRKKFSKNLPPQRREDRKVTQEKIKRFAHSCLVLSESKEQTQKIVVVGKNNLCLEKELFVFANFGFVSERKEEVNLKTDSEVKKTFSGLFFCHVKSSSTCFFCSGRLNLRQDG